MTPSVLAAQMTRPDCASGIQPAGSKARTISAASARWRMADKNPCRTQVFAPRAACVNASDGPQPAGNKRELDRNPAIQNEILAGGKAGIVARQPQNNARHFL